MKSYLNEPSRRETTLWVIGAIACFAAAIYVAGVWPWPFA